MVSACYVYRWVWSEAAAQLSLEEAVGIGGFGYPVSPLGYPVGTSIIRRGESISKLEYTILCCT